MAPKKVPLLKVMALIKRKESLSFEEFDQYWTHVHGPLFQNLPITKEKLVKYVQIHMEQNKMDEISGLNGPSFCTEYDGLFCAYVKKWTDFTDILQSEEYKTIIAPDEKKFVDSERCKLFLCYDEVHWDQEDPTSFSESSSG